MIGFTQEPSRSRAITLYTAVSGAGSALGLVLGGLLTSFVSWRATLFVNLPVGVLLLALPCRLPEAVRREGRFDLAGAAAGTLGMSALVFSLVGAAQHGVREGGVLMGFAAALVLLALFVFIERRARQPILPLSLFGSAPRAGAYAIKTLLIGAMLGTFFFLTQYVQNALGFSAFEAGWAFLPLSVTQFLMVVYGVPGLLQRMGELKLLTLGLLIALAGMAILSIVDARTSFFSGVAWALVLLGFGTGAALVPLARLGMSEVGAHEAGAASGLVNVTHYFGGALGTAVLVWAVALARDAAPASARAAAADALSTAASGAAGFLALALLIVFLISMFERRGVRGPR
jgi:Na+/melibiose symporter-like transporter